MENNRDNVAETATGIVWLKLNKLFNKKSKPVSKELIEINISDNDEIPFKTGEESRQYAKEIESKSSLDEIPKPIFKKKLTKYNSMEEIDEAFKQSSKKVTLPWR